MTRYSIPFIGPILHGIKKIIEEEEEEDEEN